MLTLVVEQDGFSQKSAPVTNLQEITTLKELRKKIYVDDRIKQYIVDLVWASRDPKKYDLEIERLVELGASPRATIALYLMAQAEALLDGETFVTPQNIKDVALAVFRHRIIPTYEAEAQGLDSDALVQMILDGVPVP